MRVVVRSLLLAVVVPATAWAQGKWRDSLEIGLRQSLRLTKVSPDGMRVTSTGTVLTVQRPGIRVEPATTLLSTRTHITLAGEVRQAEGRIAQALAGAQQRREFALGDSVYLTKLDVQKDAVDVVVMSKDTVAMSIGARVSPGRYRATLRFDFPPKYLEDASPAEVVARMSQVLQPESGPMAQASMASATPPVSPGRRSESFSSPLGVRRVSSLRDVDFLNFTYQPELCDKYGKIGSTVTVINGVFEAAGPNSVPYLVITKPSAPGTLGNSNSEAVVIHAYCRFGNQADVSENFVYVLGDSTPALFGKVTDEDVELDYYRRFPRQRGYAFWGTTSAKIDGGLVVIDALTDSLHCCPKFVSTFRYRWTGTQFVLSGPITKQPFNPR